MRESVLVNKNQKTSRSESYLVERRSDQEYSSDQDPAGKVGLAEDSHHHSYIVVDFDDHIEAVKAGTLKLPTAIRKLSVL